MNSVKVIKLPSHCIWKFYWMQRMETYLCSGGRRRRRWRGGCFLLFPGVAPLSFGLFPPPPICSVSPPAFYKARELQKPSPPRPGSWQKTWSRWVRLCCRFSRFPVEPVFDKQMMNRRILKRRHLAWKMTDYRLVPDVLKCIN